MAKTIFLVVAVIGHSPVGDKRRRTPEPEVAVSALQIRSDNEAASTVAARLPDPVKHEGQCQQLLRGNDFNPIVNADGSSAWTCGTGTDGSWNATAAGLHTLGDCAQFASETCGAKAEYISFHKGEVGFQENSGDCSWFTAARCTCATQTTVNCKTSALLTTQYETAKIVDLFTPPTEQGNGPPPLTEGTTTVDNPDIKKATEPDPTTLITEAQNALINTGQPEAAQLMTIASATEIDMKMLRENPSAVFEEMKKIGQLESQGEPECPKDQVAQQRRGEWMCMSQMYANSAFTTYIVCISLGVFAVFFGILHLIGRRMRGASKNDDDGEEEEFGEEEEYEDEEDQ